MFRTLACTFALIGISVPLVSQNPAPDADTPSSTLRINSRAVLVDVIVTDRKGNPVTGLKRDAFTVTEQGKPHFEQAAGNTDPIGAGWAFLAAKRLGKYDGQKWRSLLETSRDADEHLGNSLGTYAAAIVERELGDKQAAEAGFRKALLMPDGQMAHHQARLAIFDGIN